MAEVRKTAVAKLVEVSSGFEGISFGLCSLMHPPLDTSNPTKIAACNGVLLSY